MRGTRGQVDDDPAAAGVRIKEVDTLIHDEMLLDTSADVWKSSRLESHPHFYPLFRYQDYYSLSPWNLIRMKGKVVLNRDFLKWLKTGASHYVGWQTVDRQIQRVGGPQVFQPQLTSPEEIAAAVSRAMKLDLQQVEQACSDATHVVLVGGRDSMNLLLLPWNSQVVVYSAPPNLTVVNEFVLANKLDFEIRELKDEDQSNLDQEVLLNACHVRLDHFRWGGELRRIAEDLDGKAVFWKGQAGDTFFTTYWRRFFVIKGYFSNKFNRRIRPLLIAAGERLRILEESYAEKRFLENQWNRIAMMQGFHMGFLRCLTGVPVVSGYHGKHMSQLFPQIVYRKAIRCDIRPLIGEQLHGRPVWYPSVNPSPAPSKIRAGLSDENNFLRRLADRSVVVEGA